MSKFAQRFEDLTIWQRARELIPGIYAKFCQVSDYGFRDQIQRAAVSVMTNIAEGFERRSPAEFARFLDISKGSSGEVRSLLYVAEDLGYTSPDEAKDLRKAFEELSKSIAALTRTLRN